jgi:hypothetical protein
MPESTDKTHPIRVEFRFKKSSYGTALTIEQFGNLQECVDQGKQWFCAPSHLLDDSFRWINLLRVEQIIVN